MSELRSFYYPHAVHPGELISLEGSDFHHLRDVLRLGPDENVDIITYSGRYLAKIIQLKKNSSELIIQSEISQKESKYRLILWQSLIKSSKMDEVMDKATEMGVSEIVPLITERSAPLLQPKAENESRIQRWQRIIITAAKQARRDFVPIVSPPVPLVSLLCSLADADELRLFFWECAEQRDLSEYLRSKPQSHSIILLIGPEGGFSQEEASAILQKGFMPASLGPTILRAENAGFFALGLVQYLVSQFNP
ncbi:16S rRNA (uracil(1498)-N(3))-methyltransferase [bacterium]|nr:16S rRNA (uracil(1498)-N(3))-methyltransferase [bacterium]